MIELLIQHQLQKHHFIVPALKIFGEKNNLWLLLMIVITNPDEIVLPKHRHCGAMKPLDTFDHQVESLMISKVTYKIDSDQVYAKLTQTQKSPCTQSESTNDLKLLQTSQF